MANTTNYNIFYPDDYTAVADVPANMQLLAESVDTAMVGAIGNLDTILQALDTGNGVS